MQQFLPTKIPKKTLLYFLFFITSIQSQELLKGQVMCACTYQISVYRLPDSTFISKQIFNTAEFSIAKPQGFDFYLQILAPEYVGAIKKAQDNLENIVLAKDPLWLDDVQIVSEKPKAIFEKGKLQVEGTALEDQSNVFTMLNLMPDLFILDKDIQVLGKGTPLIIIDGRVASVEELDNISPQNIKNIELITAASALYNADSVLKITTKQSFSTAFFLKTQIDAKKTFRSKGSFYVANLDVNYKKNKTNYGLNFSYKPSFTFDRDIIRYSEQGIILATDSTSRYVQILNNYNLSFNIFQEINKKNTFYYQAQQTISDPKIQSKSFLLNAQEEQDNLMKSIPFLHSSYFIFSHKIDTLGQDFRWMNHYSIKTSDEKQAISSNFSENRNYFYQGLAQTFSTEPLYILPFAKHEISSGLKYQLAFSDLNFTGNKRKNSEHIFSAYSQLALKFADLKLGIGLRYEGSILKISQATQNLLNKKYHLFLPNFSLEYPFYKYFQTQFSYSFRVLRPTMSQLSPNVVYNGVASSFGTALNLSSVYRHHVEYQISYKQLLSLKANYTYEEKPYFLNIIQNEPARFLSFIDNLKQSHYFTLNARIQYQKDFWQSNNSVAYIYVQKEGLGQVWLSHAVQVASTHFFKLPKNFQIECSFKYFSPTYHSFGISFVPTIFEIYQQVRKSFLNNNLQIYLGFSARFHAKGFYYFDINLPELRREKWEFRDHIEYANIGLIFKLNEQAKAAKKIMDIEDIQRL